MILLLIITIFIVCALCVKISILQDQIRDLNFEAQSIQETLFDLEGKK